VTMQTLQIGDFVEFVDLATLGNEQPFNLTETSRWFCIIVKVGRHKRVELDLARLGYRSFYPRAKRWISHARVKTAQERPILNRYMFVEVDHPRQSFDLISSNRDVDEIIRATTESGKVEPVAFPTGWVEGLISRYMAGEWDYVTPGRFPFRDEAGEIRYRDNEMPPIGARIHVLEGEFANQLAQVTGRKGRSLTFRLSERMDDGKVEGRAPAIFVRAA